MGKEQSNKPSNPLFKTSHLVWPVLFGLCGVAWLFVDEFGNLSETPEPLSNYLSVNTIVFCLLALALIMARDLMGMWRLYFLSDKKLGFASLFRIRMLYEFTNAITPTVAGGSTLEMLFINKEGIKFGESTGISIVSLFLDELFFVLFFPLLFIVVPLQDCFTVAGNMMSGILVFFIITYLMKLVWVGILFVGIFIKPSAIAALIGWVFHFKWLRKWRLKALRTAVDIKTCSRQMRLRPMTFWVRNVCLSGAMWLFRFGIVNALILAFVSDTTVLMGWFDHVIVVARQAILLLVSMLIPTPGGSGFVEVLLNTYLGEYIPKGMVLLLITVGWRLLTYYNYLIIGLIMTPSWLRRNFKKQDK